jgi:GTP:adenosylcobinamide-phosphate guanylyltransferase
MSPEMTKKPGRLGDTARLGEDKILNPSSLGLFGGIDSKRPVLLVLAAGKGTRFGTLPKCVQSVRGAPLARHSIQAFRETWSSPVLVMVGYRSEEVSAALGADNIYIRSEDSAGGTGYAAYEAFSLPGLVESNPLLIITMGDRIVPAAIFARLVETHCAGAKEADLSFLTARYEAPKNRGKGRILRDDEGRVVRIVEEKEILEVEDPVLRAGMLDIAEGNCPLYAIRAAVLVECLRDLGKENVQGQYYLTDVVEAVGVRGGDIRIISTKPADPEYDLLCSDLTRPADLEILEKLLSVTGGSSPEEDEIREAAEAIFRGRPEGQAASIARQLKELVDADSRDSLGFASEGPVAIGISGGRLRIAFMHPDMGRFFGPAWQMPIGAHEASTASPPTTPPCIRERTCRIGTPTRDSGPT